MSAMDGLVASERHEVLRIVGDKHASASYDALSMAQSGLS